MGPANLFFWWTVSEDRRQVANYGKKIMYSLGFCTSLSGHFPTRFDQNAPGDGDGTEGSGPYFSTASPEDCF